MNSISIQNILVDGSKCLVRVLSIKIRCGVPVQGTGHQLVVVWCDTLVMY